MRCKTCEYRLWNLNARRCPECGTPFLPSDYEFVRNSVRFCCPHCNQSYYGTGEKGHLVPAVFDCVSCGTRIDMNEMVLLPTEGVHEEQTKVFRMPWLERKERGRARAWFSTIGMALVSPIRLMRSLPPDSSAGQACWFAALTTIVFMAIGWVPFTVFQMVMISGFGGGPGGVFFAGGMMIFLVFMMMAVMVLVGLWGLITHGLLRLTGRTAGGMGRTFEAICYSSGANAGTAVPCVGPWVGWIWWLVSAVLMVKERQNVRGGRAALAALTFPVLVILLVVGLYICMMVFVFSAARRSAMAGAASSTTAIRETQTVLDGVLQYGARNSGRGPDHAIQLVTGDYIAGSDLFGSNSITARRDVPVANTTLDRFLLFPADQASKVAQAAIDALPEGTVAHRLGDFVFAHHGIDLAKADPRLWIVIMSPDPDANPPVSPAADVTVGLADGSVLPIPRGSVPGALAAQNAIRAGHGLPALPDPTTVTHARPAVSDP